MLTHPVTLYWHRADQLWFVVPPSSWVPCKKRPLPFLNVFGMTGPSSNRESNPQILLVSAGSPLSSPFTISRGYWGPIRYQGAPSGAPTPDPHGAVLTRKRHVLTKETNKKVCGRSTDHNYGHPLNRKQTFFFFRMASSDSSVATGVKGLRALSELLYQWGELLNPRDIILGRRCTQH